MALSLLECYRLDRYELEVFIGRLNIVKNYGSSCSNRNTLGSNVQKSVSNRLTYSERGNFDGRNRDVTPFSRNINRVWFRRAGRNSRLYSVVGCFRPHGYTRFCSPFNDT